MKIIIAVSLATLCAISPVLAQGQEAQETVYTMVRSDSTICSKVSYATAGLH